MSTTQKQKEIMLQWMKLHPQVARGRLRTKGESRKKMKELLEDLARTINAANIGPVKTGAEWLKTWKDWKMYVLKKETKRRNHGLGTGGGSPIKISFSFLEEELLEFITPEAAGLDNIPQGGFDMYESVIEPDLDDPQEIYFEENENQLPQKRLCKNYQFLNTNSGLKTQSLLPKTLHMQQEIQSKTQSLSPGTSHVQEEQKSKTQLLSYEMVNIQKEKLALKEDELVIQRQLLEVQRSILGELQQIRNTVDTFGHLE